jgi:hypothetical protein
MTDQEPKKPTLSQFEDLPPNVKIVKGSGGAIAFIGGVRPPKPAVPPEPPAKPEGSP